MSGAVSMGYVCAALFFLSFWRRSHDRLFLFFCVAFVVLAGQRLAVGLSGPGETDAWLYLWRLAGYLVFLAAILDKNRASQRS